MGSLAPFGAGLSDSARATFGGARAAELGGVGTFWRDFTKKSPFLIGTLWLFNIAMENGPFVDGLPIKNGGNGTFM